MIRQTSPNRPFKPFPSYTDRAAWEALDVREELVAKGEIFAGTAWESLSATRYMDFIKNGNRSNYETPYFERRGKLAALALAECAEGKGRFMADIIDGVWLICEETTWVVPAHNNMYPNFPTHFELCDIEREVCVDLFAGETASMLSWIYYFLGDEIEKISPVCKRRMEIEMERRIFIPYTRHEDFSWTGLTNNGFVNNWNPWINSNVLAALLVFGETFPRYLKNGLDVAIRSINRFIDSYAEDGGCDEGPGYFNKAGASLYDFIEELGCVSDVDYLYAEPAIRNIASFIYKVYVGGDYFVNYADASHRVQPAAGLLARAGRNTGDDNLIGAATIFSKMPRDKNLILDNKMHFRGLRDLFTPIERREYAPPATSWFGGIQVLTARDQEGSFNGLFFSAKGGTNAESHNHNDIGNFVLYCDCKPVVVDAGVETYARKTFSAERYEIWTMRSKNHNVPTINGYEQLPGSAYRAHDVNLTNEGSTTTLTMELAKAYPAEAAIQSYVRRFVFERGKSLTVTDRYELEECAEPVVSNLLCMEKPLIEGGVARLNADVTLRFDPSAFAPAVEEIKLTDEKLRSAWRTDRLFVLRLTANEKKTSGEYSLIFSASR